MSVLRSGLEELRGEELASVPEAALEADLVELRRLLDAGEGEWLRRVAEFDRRKGFARDGFVSVSSWLADRCGLGWGTARDRVRMARALERMPLTGEALSAGEVSYPKARVLVSAREADPEVFSQHEETLVEAARNLTVRDLRRAVAYWRQNLDWNEALTDGEEFYEQRRLFVSRTFGEMVRVDGDLDPEGGAVVLGALNALTDPTAPAADDRRAPAQRRADALVDLCRRYLNSAEAPTTGGERPHVTVIVDLQALQGQTGGRCELDSGAVIHPETARRLACDAAITRVIVSADSEPLDLGRRTRTVPAPMRRALVVRDRHCRFPGCDRPPAWCDGHHIVHWIDGGPTALDNLILLCRRHHRLIHEAGFRLTKTNRRLRVTRPDGSVIENRAPP